MRERLLEIRAHDPEGKEVEPSSSDLVRFRAWVQDTYGADVAYAYFHTFWEEKS